MLAIPLFFALFVRLASSDDRFIMTATNRRVPRSTMSGICDILVPAFSCEAFWTSGATVIGMGSFSGDELVETIRSLSEKGIASVSGVSWQVATDEFTNNDEGVKIFHVTSESDYSIFKVGSPNGENIDPFAYALNGQTGAAGYGGQTPDTRQTTGWNAMCPIVQTDLPHHLQKICNDTVVDVCRAQKPGVVIYVVDSGIVEHAEFIEAATNNSRISQESFQSSSAALNSGRSCARDHGTHVASLVSGLTFGLSKNATIVPVAVQPGCGESGRVSDLHQGLSWVIDRHLETDEQSRPATIVTMSLLLSKSSLSSQSIEHILDEMMRLGIVVVAAAGNYATDACAFVPAGSRNVITVGALDGELPWSWSNHGECVDVWAQGAEVTGASTTCKRCVSSYSGTSQATPIVAGLIGTYLASNELRDTDGTFTQERVRSWLLGDEGSVQESILGRASRLATYKPRGP